MQKKPMPSIKAGPWIEGMDNRLPTYAVPASLLRWAVNVDIDDTGRLRSRKPVTKIVTGSAGTHSLYSCPIGTFFVDGSVLKKLNDNNTTTTIKTGIIGTVAYEYVRDKVFFSDSAQVGIIDSNGSVSSWGPTTEIEISVLAGDNTYVVDRYGPVPTGSIIRHHRGRMYIVSGNVVWYSDPWAFDRFKARKNYRQYSKPITVFEPVTNGIWCVADQTYFLVGGNPEEFQSTAQLNYGAIAGTGTKIPNTNDVAWMSQRGVCVGDQDGNVTNIQEKHIAINPGSTGASIVREHDGLRQFIASYNPTGTTTLAASDWMTFEQIR